MPTEPVRLHTRISGTFYHILAVNSALFSLPASVMRQGPPRQNNLPWIQRPRGSPRLNRTPLDLEIDCRKRYKDGVIIIRIAGYDPCGHFQLTYKSRQDSRGGVNMKMSSVPAGLIAATLLFLVGCSSMNAVSLSCDDLRRQKNISKQIAVNTREAFTVNLCSNASTGFRWQDSANISDKTIVRQIDHKHIAPAQAMPGAPGQQTWTFEALRKGTVQITNEYGQPWPGGEKSAWKLILNVLVK